MLGAGRATGRRTALCALVLFASIAGVAGKASAAAAAGTDAACAPGQAALASGQLTAARESFSDVLAADPGSRCAIAGLIATTLRERLVQGHCTAGSVLAKEGETTAARGEYDAALRIEPGSSCAAAGLESLRSDGGGTSVGDVIDYVPKVSAALTAVLVVLAVVLGLVALGVLMRAAWRGRKPSLVVNPLGDGGVDPPLGSAVTALLQQRLIAIGRRGRGATGEFDLDFVVADVELLTAESDLNTAFRDIAAIPNLELVAGIAAILERTGRRHRLVVSGDLLPPGRDGSGLALAVGDRDAVRARETLWADQHGAAGGAIRAAVRGRGGSGGTNTADPYYGLVERAASWVQYATARQLDGRVELITTSAESFAELGEALQLHRQGRLAAAAEAYRRALMLDADNVAALVNLAVLYGRTPGGVAFAVELLEQALAAVVRRHATVGEVV